MLKGMGLGLHKLELPTLGSNNKQPAAAPPAAAAAAPAPAKPQTTAKAAEPVSNTSVSAPAVSAPSPTTRPAATESARARDEAERTAAQEPARSEARLLADAGRNSAPAAAITASSGNTPRSTVVADARDCPTPTYPERSYRNGETGTVLLSLLVGNDGRVIESKVQKSSGFPELDKATRKAVAQCKFKPADGQTEPVWTKMVYAWSLDQ